MTMDFSDALKHVRNTTGARITRQAWADQEMYVVYQKGYPRGIAINANTARATGIAEGTVCQFEPYLMVCTENGWFSPWTPTQVDLLEYDWEIMA